MTKLILTASILSLLITPAFAAEEGFLSKLEQGIKAEANTRLQGAVGTTIKGNLPSSAQRIAKPAVNELVKEAVDASSSAIKRNSTQTVAAQQITQEKNSKKSAKTPETAFSSTASAKPKEMAAILKGGITALTEIPKPNGPSRFKRDCGAWSGDGKDCMIGKIDALPAQFPQIKDRVAVRHGILAVGTERIAWSVVYDETTGTLNMGKATEVEIKRIAGAVERTNELIGKGIIHPDTVTFRGCIRRQVPMTPWGKAKTKAEVCS